MIDPQLGYLLSEARRRGIGLGLSDHGDVVLDDARDRHKLATLASENGWQRACGGLVRGQTRVRVLDKRVPVARDPKRRYRAGSA